MEQARPFFLYRRREARCVGDTREINRAFYVTVIVLSLVCKGVIKPRPRGKRRDSFEKL